MDQPAPDARLKWGGYYYSLARACCRKGRLAEALNCFCSAFLLRNGGGSGETGQDWLTFFNVQFTEYLLGKGRLEVLLPEGDMVYALIRDRWTALKKEIEDSPLGQIRDLFGWAKTVQIDFPYGPETLDMAAKAPSETEDEEEAAEPGRYDAVLRLLDRF